MPSLLLAQRVYQYNAQIHPQLMHRQEQIKVVNQVQETTMRVADLGTFRLSPSEVRAVVRTNPGIFLVDKISMPMRQDAFMQQAIYMLPELYYAKVAGTNEQISYRIVFIDAAPLRYDFGRNLFEGIIRFLPVEVSQAGNEPPVQKSLSVPEEIRISHGSTSIPMNITQVNWPPLDVPIVEPESVDSVMVRILTIANPQGYVKDLPVEPAVILSTARTGIQGLGVQKLPFHVVLKGITRYRPVPVSIETSLGSIDPASLTLSDDQSKEVILRSEGLGPITLKAISPNFRSNSISIVAKFPWTFFILAILGGLLGGIAKNLTNQKKITLGSVVLGCLIGLIAAVAYWGLGIKLVNLSFEASAVNELAVLGLGLIAAYFGLSANSKPA
jgi:hypothetical protein